MKNIIKKYCVHAFLFGLAIGMWSCSEMNEFEKYIIPEGEISYTGKIDSLTAYSGKNRVLLEGLMISDPKITEARIYWNTGSDSISVPIVRTNNVDTLSVIIDGLDENVYNFEVRTFDALGNSSVAQYKSKEVFGERYQQSLTNRPIISSSLASDSSLTIVFATMDLTTGVFGTEVIYLDDMDVAQTQFVSIDSSSVNIPNFDPDNQFTYRSLFLPIEGAIDIFYSEDITTVPEVINLSFMLSNIEIPFQAESNSGRWGVLADWTTNEAAKNHDGYGGWDEWSDGIFNLESGWGAPLITNGKVYQTITLEAGTYIFKAHPRAKDSGIDSGYTLDDNVYLTVAEGTTLPDSAAAEVETDPTTLGFKRLVKTMSPDNAEVTFTVTGTTTVSLGISTTQGDARYCNMEAFSFLRSNI